MAQDIKRKEQVMKQVVEMLNNFATNWGPEKADKAFDLFESALEGTGFNLEMCSEGSWTAEGEDYRTIAEMVVGVLAAELVYDPAGRGRPTFVSEFRAAMDSGRPRRY